MFNASKTVKNKMIEAKDDNELITKLMESLSFSKQMDKKFLEERKVFLWGAVTDHTAKHVVERLLYLESEKPGEEIKFYINSPGGIVTSGMIMYDTMQMITSPVATICIGMAASMGSLLLSGGEKGKRYIWPSGRVMIHQPSIGGVIQGQASDIAITAREIVKTKKESAKILAENCGHSVEKILEDFDRDYWMNATESKNYGIVDEIINKI